MNTIITYALCFFLYSFLGWFFESCYCSIKPRTFINRGFLSGPLCPIYGTGALTFMIGVGPLKRINLNIDINEDYYLPLAVVLVFIASLVLADMVEFTVSVVMEKLFNARWWDYSDSFLNLQGRICFTHSIYWGVAGTAFLYLLSPSVLKLMGYVNFRVKGIILLAVLAVFAIDCIRAVYKAADVRKLLRTLDALTDKVTALVETGTEAAAVSIVYLLSEGTEQLEQAKKKYEEISKSIYKKGKEQNRLLYIVPRIRNMAREKIDMIDAKITEIREKFE